MGLPRLIEISTGDATLIIDTLRDYSEGLPMREDKKADLMELVLKLSDRYTTLYLAGG
jgi:hypothetical protein